MSDTTVAPREVHTQSLVRRHPLICFYVLTYAITWSLWAPLVIFRDRLPGPLGLVLAMLGSLVPSALGILFVALLRGRSGVRTLLGRLLHARIGLRWYLAALALTMLTPLAVGVSILMGGDTPVVDNTIFGVLFLFAFMISRAALWVKNSDGGVSSYHVCRPATVPWRPAFSSGSSGDPGTCRCG